ncbi:unnamed protein product [Somion occarium]|uniref:C2H2-type domain-containing protein n=1 Tax=Somion occarium TaxID=3059160 RepID=A0ABP1E6K6_9APHY
MVEERLHRNLLRVPIFWKRGNRQDKGEVAVRRSWCHCGFFAVEVRSLCLISRSFDLEIRFVWPAGPALLNTTSESEVSPPRRLPAPLGCIVPKFPSSPSVPTLHPPAVTMLSISPDLLLAAQMALRAPEDTPLDPAVHKSICCEAARSPSHSSSSPRSLPSLQSDFSGSSRELSPITPQGSPTEYSCSQDSSLFSTTGNLESLNLGHPESVCSDINDRTPPFESSGEDNGDDEDYRPSRNSRSRRSTRKLKRPINKDNRTPARQRAQRAKQKAVKGKQAIVKSKQTTVKNEGEGEADCKDKRVACPVEGCNNTVARQADLARHMEIHTGRRNACEVEGCPNTWLQVSNYETHFGAAHSNNRNAKCKVCGKRIPNFLARTRHQIDEHPEVFKVFVENASVRQSSRQSVRVESAPASETSGTSQNEDHDQDGYDQEADIPMNCTDEEELSPFRYQPRPDVEAYSRSAPSSSGSDSWSSGPSYRPTTPYAPLSSVAGPSSRPASHYAEYPRYSQDSQHPLATQASQWPSTAPPSWNHRDHARSPRSGYPHAYPPSSGMLSTRPIEPTQASYGSQYDYRQPVYPPHAFSGPAYPPPLPGPLTSTTYPSYFSTGPAHGFSGPHSPAVEPPRMWSSSYGSRDSARGEPGYDHYRRY